MRLINVCLFALAGISFAASCTTATVVNGGTITFRGAIVEGGCNTTTTYHVLTIDCPQDVAGRSQRLDFDALTTSSPISSQLASVQVRYLNSQHSMVLVGISYN